MQNLEQVSKLLFPDEAELNKTPGQKFDDEIRQKIFGMLNQRLAALEVDNQAVIDTNENYREIADFIRDHVLTVGKEQAVRDFQSGLNFLHKDLKEALKEDGDFGVKTFRAFYEIFKHYDIEIIKNAIRKGALSNTVIGTASDKTLNTQKLVNQVQTNLGGIN